MKEGTYAEAVKVGFTPEQAGFFARFGMDTKDEAVDEAVEIVFKKLEELEVVDTLGSKLSKFLRSVADKIDN